MNKKIFFTSVVLSILSAALIAFASLSDIQYPVAELGNCGNEAACRAYCDNSANMEVCLSFAEAHNLMTAEEIEKARKFLNVGSGPGGCATEAQCESYCDSIDHMDECIAFAEENGLMSAAELAEAKKVQAARARGVKMPACGNKKDCDVYCSEASHMEECITFAQEAGLIPAEELEEAKKVLAAIKAGAVPPPCAGKEECDIYCSQEEHFQSCLDFALVVGFMNQEEYEMARKTKGKGPGGCRGKEECDLFCQQEGNMEICAQFAYDNGMMTKEEFEMMKKTGGKGPGGCKSKEECENFCDNSDNQEICFNFAKEHGLISEEEIRNMEQGRQQFQQVMQDMPPEVYSCLESLVGADTMLKFKNGEAMPPKEIGDQMRECFEQSMPQMPGNMQPGIEPGMGAEQYGSPPGIGAGAGPMIILKQKSSGIFDFTIIDPNGIKSFAFTAAGESPYSGGIGGCPKEFKSDSSFFNRVQYPITAVITNCNDEITEITIISPGGSFGSSAGGGMEDFGPPEGYQEEHYEQQMQEFMPPQGMLPGPPEGERDKEENGRIHSGIQSTIEPLPPKVKECLKSLFGEETLNRMVEGYEMPPSNLGEIIGECYTEFYTCDFNFDGTVDEDEKMKCEGPPSNEAGESTSALDLIIGTVLGPFLEIFR